MGTRGHPIEEFSTPPPRWARLLGVLLRLAYSVSMLHFLPLGMVLYFFPESLALTLGVHPLWLARLSGAALASWGAPLAAAPRWPHSLLRYGMALVNLLSVATLLPAALRGAEPRLALLVACVLLGLSAVAGILAKDVDGR